MKKFKILLVFILIAGLFAQTADAKRYRRKAKKKTTVKVEKGYTVPTAKATAFKGVKTVLPLADYKDYLTDKSYSDNMQKIKDNAFVIGEKENPRTLYPSYCGTTLFSYGIRYHKAPERVWVYTSKGKLLRIEIDNNSSAEVFPRTSLTYNSKGTLSNVTFYVSKSNQYNFDGKGNLIIHWVGTKAYSRSGKLMKITRTIE